MRRLKKKPLKIITMNQEQIHQLLLNINDKDILLSSNRLQYNPEEDFSSFLNEYQHVRFISFPPNLNIEDLEVLRDTDGSYVVQ
ncbi:TPA: hypothetical protein QCS32_006286, partial [Bacillus thuringiensis]|nr:hypothetical protein [Bacillus thuringiensis]